MKIRKIIAGLSLLIIPYACGYSNFKKREKIIEIEIKKELGKSIEGIVIAEERSQEIKSNPGYDGVFAKTNPTMSLGEKFYVIKLKTPEGKIYGINVLDGLNYATKEGLDLLITSGTKISFPASDLYTIRYETNFYRNPEQCVGSKHASRIKILP